MVHIFNKKRSSQESSENNMTAEAMLTRGASSEQLRVDDNGHSYSSASMSNGTSRVSGRVDDGKADIKSTAVAFDRTIPTSGGEGFARLYLKSQGIRKKSISDYFSYHGIQKAFLLMALFGLASIAVAAGVNTHTYKACDLQVAFKSRDYSGEYDACCKCICDIDEDLCGGLFGGHGTAQGFDYQILPRAPLGPLNAPESKYFWNNVIANGSALFGIVVSSLQVIFAFATQNFHQILGAWLVMGNIQISYLMRQVDVGVPGSGHTWTISHQQVAIACTYVSTGCGILALFLLKPLKSTFGEVRFEHAAFGVKKRVVLDAYQRWFSTATLDLQTSLCFLSCILFTGETSHIIGVSMWIACELVSTPLLVFFVHRECKSPIIFICVVKLILGLAWCFELVNMQECLISLVHSSKNMHILLEDESSYIFPDAHSAARALLNVCPSVVGIIIDDKMAATQNGMGIVAFIMRNYAVVRTCLLVRMMRSNPGKFLDLFFDVPKQAAPKAKIIEERMES